MAVGELNQIMLKEVIESLEKSSCVFFGRYQGLNVSDFSDLRRRLEKVADRCFVIKNSIARLALKKIGAEDAQAFIDGSIFLTVGTKEPQEISKALVKFAKGRKSVEIKGALLDGKAFQSEYVSKLASLPSRLELIAKIAGGIKAPVTGFVCGLNSIIRSFVIAINEIKKKKE